MHCHLHRGDWNFHLTNEKKKDPAGTKVFLCEAALSTFSNKTFVVKLSSSVQLLHKQFQLDHRLPSFFLAWPGKLSSAFAEE